jgi:two-component sensor histidine kinase/CHASE3 domain sensor protein
VSSPSRIKALMTGSSFWRMREEVSSSALLIGFGILLLVAAISTYLAWDTSYRNALARQANEIRVASLELLNAVQNEEIAAKDFLVTGDDAALAAHGRAEESLRGKLANLTQLAALVGRHGDVMKTIGEQISARAVRFKVATEARRTEGLDVVFNQQFREVSEASLDELGGLLRQMANTEMGKLVQSRSDTEIGRWWLAVGSTTSFLLSALLCIGALFLLRRRVNLLKASERVLSAFNAQLEMSVRQRTGELETAKAELEREKDRAEALLADLSHRVGNSLQIVSSLLGMHGARIQSQEARDVIESVRGSVHAIASAQRRVRLSGTNNLVEVNQFLENLIHDLRSALGGNDKVAITLKAGEVVALSHDAVSIGVIVTEAINNAVKHAGQGEGQVSISVTLEGDRNKNPLRVVIEDDGTGFDEAGSHAGLGSQITEALSASLRAKLSRSHVLPDGPRRGTRIELVFSTTAAAA